MYINAREIKNLENGYIQINNNNYKYNSNNFIKGNSLI